VVSAVHEKGLLSVAKTINDVSSREFVYGRITAFIYETNGKVIANGERPTLAGFNVMNERDESGSLYAREIIQQALKDEKAWVSYLLKKSIVSVYAEKVDIEGKAYVVGASFFPMSKESSVEQLVKSAIYYLESMPDDVAFRAFGGSSEKFVLGDLTVFVYGLDGTCYVDGFDADKVWRNRLQAKDDDGFLYVKSLIDQGKSGHAKVSFKKNNGRMVAYVESIKKGENTFIVGSGYYL
jgi:signal transduction histidine kinase